MINLPKACYTPDIETALLQLAKEPAQELRLPIVTGTFGLYAQLIQFIGQWGISHPDSPVLYFPGDFTRREDTRRRFASTPSGQAALYFCDAVRSVGGRTMRQEALHAMEEFAEAMERSDFVNTARGTGTFLCCFQNEDREFLPNLYDRFARGRVTPTGEEVTVHNTSGFTALLESMLSVYTTRVSDRFGDRLEMLGGMTYQLFKNADIHTVTDAGGALFQRGLRGIYLRHFSVSVAADINLFAVDDRNLHIFLTRTATDKSIFRGPSKDFIEISVFDTGPGLALHWLRAHGEREAIRSYRDIGLDTELEAVRKCFVERASSFTGRQHGDGLAIALEHLTRLRGFLTMRTGRLSLYQDFSREKVARFEGRDRYPERQLAPTSGVSYTLCIPVPDLQ